MADVLETMETVAEDDQLSIEYDAGEPRKGGMIDPARRRISAFARVFDALWR